MNMKNPTFQPTYHWFLSELHRRFFEHLDDIGVEYTIPERIGNDQTEMVLSDQFRYMTSDEKAQYLGFRDLSHFINEAFKENGIIQPLWVEFWQREMLNGRPQ